MKFKLLVTAISLGMLLPGPVLLAADAPSTASESNKPLAMVNGVAVPKIYTNFIRQGRINRGAGPETLSEEALKDAVITAELLSQEAVRKGLDKGPLLISAMEFQKKEMLSQALIEDFARSHPISDDAIKVEYNNAKAKAGEAEYRASHILVNTEKEAQDIITKLTTGKKAKFEVLAKSSSKDSSAGNGGDLGWVLPANLVPEFANAMVKMKKGDISKTPVQTKFGWHVIRLDETRKLDFPEFEKIKNRIGGQMQQLQLRKYVQELRATAKVE